MIIEIIGQGINGGEKTDYKKNDRKKFFVFYQYPGGDYKKKRGNTIRDIRMKSETKNQPGHYSHPGIIFLY